MVYSSRQTFSTRRIHVWVDASFWLADRLVASQQRIAYCHGLKWARRKTGTDWQIKASFVSWLWDNGWKHKWRIFRTVLVMSGLWSTKHSNLCQLQLFYIPRQHDAASTYGLYILPPHRRTPWDTNKMNLAHCIVNRITLRFLKIKH